MATRLERGGRFWEIARADDVVTIVAGKVGTPGTTQVERFGSEWDALGAVIERTRAQRKKGYRHVVGGALAPASPVATNAALERAIRANPDSDEAFEVYADHLQQHGDVRGELAVLQARFGKRPSAKLAAAIGRLLWMHRVHFYGPLAVYRLETGGDVVQGTWRHGWMDSLALAAISAWDLPEGAAVGERVDDLVAALPQVASAKFARELVLGRAVADGRHDFGTALAALANVARSLPLLRRIVVGEPGDRDLSETSAGDLSPLWPAFPKLESLLVHAGAMRFGTIDAPRLRSLRIETGGLDQRALAAILAARAPKLETLNLWFGHPAYGSNCKLADIVKLLDGTRFEKLRHLGLANTIYGDELAPQVAASALVTRLETLDLSRSHLTIEGIRALVAQRAKFAHLQRLDLSRCLLDAEAQQLARSLCARVELGDQATPSHGERYTAVGE